MKPARSIFRTMALAVLAGAVILGAAPRAMADKIHLKDGRVLEGTVEKQADGYVVFKIKTGGIEQTQIFSTDEYTKIERDADPAPATPKKDDAKPAAKPGDPAPVTKTAGAPAPQAKTTGTPHAGGATKVVVLNFGPPSSWSDKVGNMVGVHIAVEAFKNAVPMLEKEGFGKDDIVVIRVNSGGGYVLETNKFQDLFKNVYKQKFRTVAWIESAISAAAMSPYPLEEMYFLPEGNLGACTAWSGALKAVKGIELEVILAQMENVSRDAGRSPFIMRSMEIMEPLSAKIDPVTGEVTWFQDDSSGDYVLNHKNHILTLTAQDAVKFKFAKAIAKDRDELVKAMGLTEVEWAGKAASDYVDNFMREAEKTEKKFDEVLNKYLMAIQLAESAQDRQERAAQVGRAKGFLNQLEKWVGLNPNFQFHFAGKVGALLDHEWFEIQRERLKDLLK